MLVRFSKPLLEKKGNRKKDELSMFQCAQREDKKILKYKRKEKHFITK